MEAGQHHNRLCCFSSNGPAWLGRFRPAEPLGLPQPRGRVDFGANAEAQGRHDAAASYDANSARDGGAFMKEWLEGGQPSLLPGAVADLKAVDYGYDASTPSCSSAMTTCGRGGLASPTT